jgi:hypothetical protein
MNYKWKPQTSGASGAMMVPYIDARDVVRELDKKYPMRWSNTYDTIAGMPFCSITVHLEDGTDLTRTDTGDESHVSARKGQASDAFKRAAVKFGIGIELYEMESIKLPTKVYNGKYYPCHPDTGEFLKGQALHDYCNSVAEIKVVDDPAPASTAIPATPPKP